MQAKREKVLQDIIQVQNAQTADTVQRLQTMQGIIGSIGQVSSEKNALLDSQMNDLVQ
jgi:hypothetical protein